MLSRLGFALALVACASALPCSAQTLVTDIPLPGGPNGIAVNPHNNRIYVAVSTSNGPAVSVIDGVTNTVIDSVSTPQGAQQVGVNLVTGRVYAAGCNFGQSPATCTVTVIDGTTDAILATVPLAGSNGIGIQGIAVNPRTNKIYVSDDMNYELAVIDGNTNHTAYINTGNTEMLGLAIDYASNAIVGAPSGAVVDVIHAYSHSIQRISVGTINQDVAVNFFTGHAFVTNNYGSTLGVVDLSTEKVITNITVGSAPFGVCVDYLSNLIFVANTGDGTVAVVDGSTNTKIASITASSNYIDVNPATKLVYASDTFGNVVHVISE